MSNILSFSGLYHEDGELPTLHKGDSHPLMLHLVQKSSAFARIEGKSKPLEIIAPAMPTPRVSIDFCDIWDLIGRLKSALMSSVASLSPREGIPSRAFILDVVELPDDVSGLILNESELASRTMTNSLAESIFKVLVANALFLVREEKTAGKHFLLS